MTPNPTRNTGSPDRPGNPYRPSPRSGISGRVRYALVVAAALLAAPSAPALEGGSPAPGGKAPPATPEEAYAARLKEIGPQIASKLEKAATFALRNKLAESGYNVFQLMKEFDPGNEKANRELGYEKKGAEWVPVEAKRKKVDEAEDESSKKEPEFLKYLKEGQVAAARLLAELGELAQKAGKEDEARAHWKKSLGLDDQNALANQKIGNHLVDGKWLTDRAVRFQKFQKDYRATLDKAQKMAVNPAETPDTTGIAEKAGIPITRQKTANFRIESNLPKQDIRDTLIWLERAREFYLRLFEIPERLLDYSSAPQVFVIVTTDEQKDKLIDACDGIASNEKSFKKKFGAVAVGDGKLQLAGFPNGGTAERECIHIASHSMVRDSLGQHAPWLKESLANAVAASVREANLKVCFSGEGSTGGIHTEMMTLEQAPGALRAYLVEYDQKAANARARGEEPKPSILAMESFVGLPSDGMNQLQIAKGWSVVMFLLERDRLQAREYFSSAGQGNGDRSKDDRVLKQYFEDFATWKDLDLAWRDWALDVYKP